MPTIDVNICTVCGYIYKSERIEQYHNKCPQCGRRTEFEVVTLQTA